MSDEVKFVKSLYSTFSPHPAVAPMRSLKTLYLLYLVLEMHKTIEKAVKKPKLRYLPIYVFMPYLYLIMFALVQAANREVSQ